MGLTLDFDSHYVYWIVRGQEGSHLYRASMMRPGVIVNKIRVALLARTNIAGPLSYFNGRLLWLRDEKIAAISDMNGAYVACMEGKSLSGLKMVYAIDDSLQHYAGMCYTKIEKCLFRFPWASLLLSILQSYNIWLVSFREFFLAVKNATSCYLRKYFK